jgi:hypothetical protein
MRGCTELEELWPLSAAHARARSATPQVGPHWTATVSYGSAKGADACGTLGSAPNGMGREGKCLLYWEVNSELALPTSWKLTKQTTQGYIYGPEAHGPSPMLVRPLPLCRSGSLILTPLSLYIAI